MGQFAQYNRAIKHRWSDYDGKKQTRGHDRKAERGAGGAFRVSPGGRYHLPACRQSERCQTCPKTVYTGNSGILTDISRLFNLHEFFTIRHNSLRVHYFSKL